MIVFTSLYDYYSYDAIEISNIIYFLLLPAQLLAWFRGGATKVNSGQQRSMPACAKCVNKSLWTKATYNKSLDARLDSLFRN